MKIKRRNNLSVGCIAADYTGKRVFCKNVSWVGHQTCWARPGSWITYSVDMEGLTDASTQWKETRIARVFASVEGKNVGDKPMLAVVSLSGGATCGFLRWVDPEKVITIVSEDRGPPFKLLNWIAGEGFEEAAKDPYVMLRMLARGVISDDYIEGRDEVVRAILESGHDQK